MLWRWLLVMLLWPQAALAEVRSLPVLTATLYPGDVISPALLAEKSFTGSPRVFAGYVLEARDIEGKFARRTIVAGLPIAEAAVKDRDVVFQGTAALAILNIKGMEISATLLPLESGAAGQAIRARNPDSGLTITAIAQDDGTLRVEAQ